MLGTVELFKEMLVDELELCSNLSDMNIPLCEIVNMTNDSALYDVTMTQVVFIHNLIEAFNYMIESAEWGLSTAYLFELNKLINHGLHRGLGLSLRTTEKEIEGTDWRPDIPSQGAVTQRVYLLNGIMDIEQRALKYFCYILRTQPFDFYNECLALAVANKELIKGGVGVLYIGKDKMITYKKLLLKFYESGDDFELIEFLTNLCIVRRMLPISVPSEE